ncbi:hypothetical protein S7335_672 [Synechococcus sp. PCC 7335]|uniref:hypothetical protein n=1 Tax=Synechococcus sp. (strain ATCC 29403 / PCC 7335) TaxID=91464 RepID=UPI00017ED9EC|nr:hypothetical protein [Synechococcus sp. PCC 7335]EDX83492.1 hypothetical protein S7335_672 [Synechococcus sp. PCC 7335]
MSAAVLPQLQTVSSKLEAEAASIEQQLLMVREKRKGHCQVDLDEPILGQFYSASVI